MDYGCGVTCVDMFDEDSGEGISYDGSEDNIYTDMDYEVPKEEIKILSTWSSKSHFIS